MYGADEARAIARIVGDEHYGFTREQFAFEPDAAIEATDFADVLHRLCEGEPVQYVTGVVEWHGLRLAVGKGVLVPRPETEELVDWIVSDGEADTFLDLGTGSGAIAIALAEAFPKSRVTGIDLSDTALRYAEKNNLSCGTKVEFRKDDILNMHSEERFDVMVSNPPYVPQSDLRAMHRNVRDYEPHEALFVPDNDMFRYYRAIARYAARHLNEGGRLYCEVYADRIEQLMQTFESEGLNGTELRNDLFGKPRMTRWIKRQK